MFESDDIDDVLSLFDFSEEATVKLKEKENVNTREFAVNLKTNSRQDESQSTCNKNECKTTVLPCSITSVKSAVLVDNIIEKVGFKVREENKEVNSTSGTFLLPKNNKRKIINSCFDHQSKIKFPGPAGLLTGALEIPKDENICPIELLSQDIDYTHNLRRDLFDLPIWSRLVSDIQAWILDIDSIKAIKQQTLSGNLKKNKAKYVTAFIETVDRSAIDPSIILRDATGFIECTLHRDAWSTFSQYIASDCCALILQKPTILIRGGTFKKHYLNITLGNILAIYSSAVLSEDAKTTLPDGYSIVYEDEFTVIKTKKCSDSLGTSLEQSHAAEDLFNGLDSFFSDDMF